MGMWHVAIGVTTIIVLSFIWVSFSYSTNLLYDMFTGMYSSLTPDYLLGKNYVYYSFFFLIVVIFVWMIKETGREAKNPYA